MTAVEYSELIFPVPCRKESLDQELISFPTKLQVRGFILNLHGMLPQEMPHALDPCISCQPVVLAVVLAEQSAWESYLQLELLDASPNQFPHYIVTLVTMDHDLLDMRYSLFHV